MRLILAFLFLVSCGASPLSFLTGGGPNVAANTQIGRTNTQTLGQTNVADTLIQSRVQAGKVEKVVVNEGQPPWVLLAQILGAIFLWQLPSPGEMGRWFHRKRLG